MKPGDLVIAKSKMFPISLWVDRNSVARGRHLVEPTNVGIVITTVNYDNYNDEVIILCGGAVGWTFENLIKKVRIK